METVHIKFKKLQKALKKMGSVAVAFSGGVDSTFLLMVANQTLGDDAIAITALSTLFPVHELNEASDFSIANDIRHVLCDMDIFAISGFAENPENRCYLCKKSIFTKFKEVVSAERLKYLVEGSNVDDDSDYRPGSQAIRELGVASPLREAGFTKAEIRQLSHEMNLPTWDKPSFACLASRIPYGEPITREKLKTIEASEQILFDLGFRQVRVRHHGTLARVEIDPTEMEKLMAPATCEIICTGLQKAGFVYVTVDLQGYRVSGRGVPLRSPY
jgi:uncharacterized protein